MNSFSNQILDKRVVNDAVTAEQVCQVEDPSWIMDASLAPAFHW